VVHESEEIKKIVKPKWPHLPLHIFYQNGTIIVTGATLYKHHFFDTSEKLTILQNNLFELTNKFKWSLQAWSLFSNHYHFIVSSESPLNFSKFIQHFHGRTSFLLNKLDRTAGRSIWYQYWDTRVTYQKSHFARLNYVINNPVKHKLVDKATDYPWRSAAWFEKTAPASFVESIKTFKIDRIDIQDDFF